MKTYALIALSLVAGFVGGLAGSRMFPDRRLDQFEDYITWQQGESARKTFEKIAADLEK